MIYLGVTLILILLVFDAFSETIVNGSSLFKSFKVRWLDRFWNFKFRTILNSYNDLIDEKGMLFTIAKETFEYLDYDEYVTFKIYKKNTIINMEYSITHDKVMVRTTYLKELKKHSYFGRYMNHYYKSLHKADYFDGNYEKLINQIIVSYPEATSKRKEMMVELEKALIVSKK